jgi:hypothetical protein
VSEQPARVCGHWIGSEHRYCRTTDGVRHYLPGYRCPAHTPRALRGLAEIPPGPGLPAGAWTTVSPLNESRVHDALAIVSGKRRASQAARRAALTVVASRGEWL